MSDVSAEHIGMLVELLVGASRRERQEAAHELALAAKEDPNVVCEHLKVLVKALKVSEAQTRWEIMDILTLACSEHADVVAKALGAAEDALFDETSATVRLSAFRMLTRLAATTPARSKRIWPLLDEAIQCFHGDAEYRDMLSSLVDFAQGNIAPATRQALIDRVKFDAQTADGYIKTYSENIISATGTSLKQP